MVSSSQTVQDHLLAWLERYFENRRLMDKTILSIVKKTDCLVLEKNNGPSKYYFILSSLEDVKVKLKDLIQPHQYIVTLNTKENFDFLVSNWDLFHSVSHFGMMFINPFSKLDKKWILFPSTHNLISDGKSIKKSLAVLFANVDEISINEFLKIING